MVNYMGEKNGGISLINVVFSMDINYVITLYMYLCIIVYKCLCLLYWINNSSIIIYLFIYLSIYLYLSIIMNHHR